MRVPSRVLRLGALSLAGTLVILVLGCGDSSGLDRRYKVSGTVTYKGEPVPSGTVTFHPEKGEGRGASGQIENGSYTLTTQDPGDGAFPGTYIVTVDSRQIDEAALKAATEKFAAQKKIEGLQQIPQELQAKFAQQAKLLTPAKYLAPQESDLKVEVKPETNTINLELKD